MIKFLHKKIPFIVDFKNQCIVAVLLGCFLALVMIFLEPFDTDGFEADNKYLIFAGFGIVFSIFYVVNSRMEVLWFNSLHKKWTVKHEIFAFVILVFISSIPIHFYNQIFLNSWFEYNYSAYDYVKHGIWFFRSSLIPIMFLLLPFYLYLRNRLGILPVAEHFRELKILGTNKGEKLVVQEYQILFVKSSENYVEIFYKEDEITKHTVFRNTLSAIKKQVPFLRYCHRSYLVNTSHIKSIKGNSQNAKIEFTDDLEIPLSNTYYKKVKSAVSI
ncbi:MAG: LytR/AlgR family response regulator transcription factor [Croceivirga sp.]